MPGKTKPVSAQTKRVSTQSIQRNPLNPRLFFREEEMDALKESISAHGILVPLVVYQSGDGAHYTLLDGERRLKCAQELGLGEVPVNVTQEPSETENILLMFNIHSLREQWDPYTIALALNTLMTKLAIRSSRELSALTGFSVGSINRSKKLLKLPPKYLDALRHELVKPKSKQQLTEDFFLEATDAVTAIRKHQPALYKEYGESLMDEFVERRQAGALPNIVDLRVVADVANYQRSGLTEEKSHELLRKIVTRRNVGLRELYSDLIEHNKQAKSVISQVLKVAEGLRDLDVDELNATTRAELREALFELQKSIRYVRARVVD